jgi:ATP-dependent helicase/nuclease subunit A
MPARKAYYISAEYLIGRLVYSNLYNLGILDEMKQLFAQRGVDLAILEDDGITVVDFKTDRVTGDAIQVVAENYFPQVRAYCKALEQIYDKPVKKSLLYFFRTGEFIQVK